MPSIDTYSTNKKTLSNNPMRVSKAGLQAFFAITKRWELNSQQERALLGNPPQTTYYRWKKKKVGRLGSKSLERISLVLGIYKNLQILLPQNTLSLNCWMLKPNEASLFLGTTPLAYILSSDNADNLRNVKRFLDAQKV